MSTDENAIELFAVACERLNGYARILRDSGRFTSIKTNADIRHYENGWRLEKWVEAQISSEHGLWACWWLELGERENHWLIESHISISHGEFFAGLYEDVVHQGRLRQVLSAVVDELMGSLESNASFAEQIAKHCKN